MKLGLLSVFFATGAALMGLALAKDAPAPLKIDEAGVVGLWYTEDREGGVELYPCGENICGRLHWLKDEDKADISRDTRNPDPALRTRPLCGMQFMGGFSADGHGRYKGGWIYSPRHGAEFSAEMTLIDRDTLDLHGYVLFPFLGQSQTWKRDNKMPSCASD